MVKKTSKKDIIVKALWMDDPFVSAFNGGKWIYICPYCNTKSTDQVHSPDCNWIKANKLMEE
jgi:hypothetical protein